MGRRFTRNVVLTGAVRAKELGQNFLRNRRTARRLVHLADGPEGSVCVDLGAGNGMITEAALSRDAPVLAVEVDPRLAASLRRKFAGEPSVTIVEADLLQVAPPNEPFVIAANPPFNVSTKLVRRWIPADRFCAGALIVERSFARRISGAHGATKVSLSLAPYFDMAVPYNVRSAEFSPAPKVVTAILTVQRRPEPPVEWSARVAYWRFVNYLFERSVLTVGDALLPLKFSGVPHAVRRGLVRDLGEREAVELFYATRSERNDATIADFELQLPSSRKVSLGSSRR
jgi:23S rRNA (adenine-N6)-dimethyltransferase